MKNIKYTQKGIMFGFIPVVISETEDGYQNIKSAGIFYNSALWLLVQGFYAVQFIHSLAVRKDELQIPITIFE